MALSAGPVNKAMAVPVTQAVPAERKPQVALSAHGRVAQTATLRPVVSVLVEMATPQGCGGTTGGGGGGGGWHGGGGGGLGAGGGGSSYATTNASAVTHNQGINFGNGQIIISW